jgi:hypothetical protein
MPAQIAFYRLHPRRTGNDIHCPKRAGQHTAFTTNTTCLFNEDMPMFTTNGVRWANIRTGSVFALMAGDRRCKGVIFDYPNPRYKRRRRDRRTVLVLLVRDDAGNFAGTTPIHFAASAIINAFIAPPSA